MKQYCLACDLKDDENLIKAYDDYHQNVWPEIKDSLQAGRNAGNGNLQNRKPAIHDHPCESGFQF